MLAARSWKRHRECPLEFLEGARPCRHLDFSLWPPEPERINFCCFKPPNLWPFVMAALERNPAENSPLGNSRPDLVPKEWMPTPPRTQATCARLWLGGGQRLLVKSRRTSCQQQCCVAARSNVFLDFRVFSYQMVWTFWGGEGKGEPHEEDKRVSCELDRVRVINGKNKEVVTQCAR